jgi:membrane-associated phospholipid phosphatase
VDLQEANVTAPQGVHQRTRAPFASRRGKPEGRPGLAERAPGRGDGPSADRPVLAPGPDAGSGHDGPIAARLRHTHPAVAVVAVAMGSYLALAATMIGLGLIVTHVLAHGSIGHWDEHVNSWFARHRSSTGNRLSGDFTLLADTFGVAAVAAAVTLVLLVRRWGALALLVPLALGIELAVFLSTTYTVARPRPAVPHVGGTPSTFSWPSGHVAATLVLYGGIAVLVRLATRRRVARAAAWTVAGALVVCVALSRISRGEHHPIDALGGALLGVGALWAAVMIIRTWERASAARRSTAEPSPTGAAEPAARSSAESA